LDLYFRAGSVEIKTAREIDAMREVGRLAADTLSRIGDIIRPGITTNEINAFAHEDTLKKSARPAPLGYRNGSGPPFPKSICTSVNEVVCHGIPGSRTLRDGDIVNVDVTHIYRGFHGDTSATFYVGRPSEDAKCVTEVARRCLELGISEVRPGARLGDIGAVIQDFAEAHGCSVVEDFVGHGIGRKFHDEPKVPHYGERGKGHRLRTGMTFTIEPMTSGRRLRWTEVSRRSSNTRCSSPATASRCSRHVPAGWQTAKYFRITSVKLRVTDGPSGRPPVRKGCGFALTYWLAGD
jgi:methionyl aminopeptidase